MNDFLTRLAERSLGAAPLIAPRLPGLFAPAEAFNSDIEDTAAVTDAAHIAARTPTPLPSRTTGDTDHTSDESRGLIHPPQRPRTSESAISPALLVNLTPPHDESTPVPRVETARSNPLPTAPYSPPVAAEPAAPPGPLRSPRKPDGHAAPEPWRPLLPKRKAESAAAFHAVAESPTNADADTVTRTAPTVHITIGRVEVRANIATPPAAPRPRVASPPALSLGDYLKRGAGAS